MTVKEEAINFLENYIGYTKTPPDIDTFINDPYYLGNTFNPTGNECLVFPKWREVLRKTYSNSVTADPFVCLTGGIGIGKTTVFIISILYSICRFLHVKSFAKFSKRANTKGYNWVFCTVKLEYAIQFMRQIEDIMESSPFFREQISLMGRQNWKKLIHIRPASRVTHLISNDCIVILLSEINEIVQVDSNGVSLGWKLMVESYQRLMSRYRNILGLFPQLFIDSSTKNADSLINQFIQKAAFKDQLHTYQYAQWEIQADGDWFKPRKDGRTKFWVYLGSPEVPEHIIDKEELSPGDYAINADRDLYIEVPIQVYKDFLQDTAESIRSIAGRNTMSGATFFSVQSLLETFKLPLLTKEVITIDERLPIPLESDLSIKAVLDSIPKVHNIYIGIDIGTKKDLTGFAVSYISEWEEKDINGDIIMIPHFKVPLVFGLDREKGQSTSITRIFNFLVYLNTRFRIGMILTDGYGSTQMLQDLTYKKIPCDKLSVESESEYSIFKNLCLQNQVLIANNSLLRAELLCLKRSEKKPGNLDHPTVGEAIIKNGKYLSAVSKDLADATCRSVLGAYFYSRDAKSGNPIHNSAYQSKLLNKLYETNDYDKQIELERYLRDFQL